MSGARQAFSSAFVNGLSDPKIRDFDLWTPQPGPQTMAFESEADELYYGGAAGGGKTDAILGIAIRNHKRSIVFRREFPQFKALIERADEILRPLDVTYKQNWNWWEFPDGRKLELGSVKDEGALSKYFGRPHDLVAFDEGVEFPMRWYRLLSAWNRHEDPSQRCRVVFASNPPLSDDGAWVIQYWAPWLDPSHPDPASPGELRWFVTVDDKSIEVDGPETVKINGRDITPRSRTFISAKLEDNAYYRESGYEALLMNLPDDMREVLLDGKFFVNSGWNAFQVFSSRLVRKAQARWVEPTIDRLPDAIGIDPARGGDDNTAIALLYYPHFALKTIPGKRTPDGPSVAREVFKMLGNFGESLADVPIGVDSIGAGTSVIDVLESNGCRRVKGIHGSAKSRARDAETRLRFANLRAQVHFRFRDALKNEDIGIPKGAEILADLTAPRYQTTTRGVQVEPKEDLKKRLKRSPDRGEAFMLCWHAYRNMTVLSATVIDEW